jgi:gp16 family phage-associated protein
MGSKTKQREQTWEEKLAEARARFRRVGYSQRQFAEELGVDPSLVGHVLSGKRRGLRGDSHRIAVALGLKEGVVVPKGTSAVQALRVAEDGHDRAA